MIAKTFVFIEKNAFSELLEQLCSQNNIANVYMDNKSDLLEECDGLVMFHNNHDFSKTADELKSLVDQNNIPTHKVDINGTIVATSSNFLLWLERNKIKKLIVTGESNLTTNPNLTRFFETLFPSH